MDGVIIVGSNSYIGGYLADYLTVQRGAEVIALSSKDCNFLDAGAVAEFFGTLDRRSYTVVFLAVVNKPEDNSFQSFTDNLAIVNNLKEGQKRANIASIVYFSSADVYGRNPALPITEESKIQPDTWYGLAKYACEWTLASSGEVACPVTVLRIPGIYGRGRNDRSVIGRLVSNIRNEKRVVIHGEGKALRDYVYVEDLCRLIVSLLPMKYRGVLNVATGQSYSVVEIAKAIGEALRTELEIARESEHAERNFDLVFDNSRLQALLPKFCFCDLREGIRSYL